MRISRYMTLFVTWLLSGVDPHSVDYLDDDGWCEVMGAKRSSKFFLCFLSQLAL